MSKKKNTVRTTLTLKKEDKQRIEELKTMYGEKCSIGGVIEYLLRLESRAFVRGTGIVEQKLLQMLALGYEGEITIKVLRYACNEQREGSVFNTKAIGFKTVKDVFEKYEDLIKEHNDKIK